jgi:hypothetical protein
MIAQVGRPFEADGVQYESGDIVDATGWPRLQRLRTLRYLLPAPKGAEVTVKVASAPEGQQAAAKAPAKKAPAKPRAKASAAAPSQ